MTMFLKHLDFRTPGVSSFSATLFALVIFFIYITGYALLVFIQFTPLQILSVGLAYAALLTALTALFMRPYLLDLRTGPLRLNLKTFATSLFITFVLIMFTHSTGTRFSDYVRTFPLLETELGLGWHQDTAFHVSLIQSILNFGYPSIAQHGHPLNAYHVLSHYVDALILFITKVDPYDSYGLLFHYKVFLFLSSILLAITAMTRNHGWITYLVSFVLLAPCIIGTWHAIASHGLWMASLILLLSAPFVFSRLFQDADVSPRQLSALLLIIVSIALAKISSGFMYGALLGAVILAKQPRALSTYLFGLVLLAFFYLYGNVFFSRLNNISGSLDLSRLSILDFYEYITATHTIRGPKELFSPLPAVLVCTAILLSLSLTQNTAKYRNAAIGSILAILALYFITQTNETLSVSDVWYFQYGTISGVLMLTFATILHYKDELFVMEANEEKIVKKFRRPLGLAAVACLALLTKYSSLPNFNVFNAGPESIQQKIAYANKNPFSSINKKLPSTDQIAVRTSLSAKKAALEKLRTSRPLKALKTDIAAIHMQRDAPKKTTALILSKEYFDNQLKPFGGISWARGLLVYAVTGTQLLYGVTGIPRGYGFTPSYEPYMALSEAFITENDICDHQRIADAVILYTTLHNGSMIRCRK